MAGKANTAKSPDENGGRDKGGRFVKGHKSKGGRKPKAATLYAQEVDQAIREMVPPKRIARIYDALATLAEAGDEKAAKILTDRLLGPPRRLPEVLPVTAEEAKTDALDEAVVAGQIDVETANQLRNLNRRPEDSGGDVEIPDAVYD